MSITFNKRQLRIVSLIAFILIVGITVARLIYADWNVLNGLQSIVANMYSGYILAHVGWNWGRDTVKPKLRIVR